MDALQRAVHADQLVVGVFLLVKDQAMQFYKAKRTPAIPLDDRRFHRIYAQIFKIAAGNKTFDIL